MAVGLVWADHVDEQAAAIRLVAVTEPYAFASAYRSASADATVGGDLLDVIDIGRGIAVIVGDVRERGWGRSAQRVA